MKKIFPLQVPPGAAFKSRAKLLVGVNPLPSQEARGPHRIPQMRQAQGLVPSMAPE